MKLHCGYCQQAIGDGETYHQSPEGEPVHKGECHKAVWDTPTEAVADGGRDVPEEQYLSEDEVADNWRNYIDALEAEISMAETIIERLEAGDLATRDMIASLPSPTPLEAWKNDRWDDLSEADESFVLEEQREEGGDV